MNDLIEQKEFEERADYPTREDQKKLNGPLGLLC